VPFRADAQVGPYEYVRLMRKKVLDKRTHIVYKEHNILQTIEAGVKPTAHPQRVLHS